MIFVDTSVWADYLSGNVSIQCELLDGLLGTEQVAIGDLVLIEVLQGFESDEDFDTAKELSLALTVFNMGGSDIAVKAASHMRTLRAKGITTLRTVNAVIATFCIENSLILLHADKGFAPFQHHLGLKVFE